MSIKQIIKIPDPVLRQKSVMVSDITDDTISTINDMAETMYHAVGIGLAAPQVNLLKRLIVVDCDSNLYRMINPEIVNRSDEFSINNEGCLSIPGGEAGVKRHTGIDVRYVDINGKVRELSCEGLLAICIQHEIDHLNGVLFIDHISKLKRDMITKRAMKQVQ